LAVSCITVSTALRQLTKEGALIRQQGKGTFVADLPRVEESLFRLISFSATMRESKIRPSSRLVSQQLVCASARVADELQIALGDEVFELVRVRLADGVPVRLETSNLPHVLCRGILNYDLANDSLYRVLQREYGLVLAKARQTIEAVLLRQSEANLLGASVGQPALLSQAVVYLNNGTPIEFQKQISRGDRYRFVGESRGFCLADDSEAAK
jgi:GntR family transcriptional regulator